MKSKCYALAALAASAFALAGCTPGVVDPGIPGPGGVAPGAPGPGTIDGGVCSSESIIGPDGRCYEPMPVPSPDEPIGRGPIEVGPIGL